MTRHRANLNNILLFVALRCVYAFDLWRIKKNSIKIARCMGSSSYLNQITGEFYVMRIQHINQSNILITRCKMRKCDKMNDDIYFHRISHVLFNKSFFLWLFPNRCQKCLHFIYGNVDDYSKYYANNIWMQISTKKKIIKKQIVEYDKRKANRPRVNSENES